MTVPPLTERLEAARNAVYTGDEGTSSYLLDDDTRALLLEAKAALEELAAKQRIDEAQCDEMTAQAGLAVERCRTQRERAETAEARLRDLADAARELIDGHGDEQLALNVLADALDAYDRDALAGTDGGEQ